MDGRRFGASGAASAGAASSAASTFSGPGASATTAGMTVVSCAPTEAELVHGRKHLEKRMWERGLDELLIKKMRRDAVFTGYTDLAECARRMKKAGTSDAKGESAILQVRGWLWRTRALAPLRTPPPHLTRALLLPLAPAERVDVSGCRPGGGRNRRQQGGQCRHQQQRQRR